MVLTECASALYQRNLIQYKYSSGESSTRKFLSLMLCLFFHNLFANNYIIFLDLS